MEPAIIKEFKEMFISIREKIMQGQVVADIDKSFGGDEADLSIRDTGLSLSLKLKGRDLFYLKKVNESLMRIEEGTFGSCNECGCDIGISRLKARPTADLCIACKEEQERDEHFIPYAKKSKTLGQGFGTSSFPSSSELPWVSGS